MFRCKDLLLLPSMAKARPLAGKEGMNNLIRWVYKPEDMNFSKWVHGNELLIVSLPVIKNLISICTGYWKKQSHCICQVCFF